MAERGSRRNLELRGWQRRSLSGLRQGVVEEVLHGPDAPWGFHWTGDGTSPDEVVRSSPAAEGGAWKSEESKAKGSP